MIKNIILDVGKVLVEWEPERAMKQLGFDEKTVETVAGATVNSADWIESDRGVLSDEELLATFISKAPAYEKEIRKFWENIDLPITQFPYTRAWIKSMKNQGIHVYILSNYGKWTFEKTKNGALNFLEDTDGAIFSYSVKQVKPDAEIYETLLNRFDLTADECVYIDDRPENIEGAESAGIHGICFESIDQVKQTLADEYGIQS